MRQEVDCGAAIDDVSTITRVEGDRRRFEPRTGEGKDDRELSNKTKLHDYQVCLPIDIRRALR